MCTRVSNAATRLPVSALAGRLRGDACAFHALGDVVKKVHNALTVEASVRPDTMFWNQLMDTYQRAGCFWEAHGGLAIFGFPISEEYADSETGYTVQYFERQRFEYHPENPPEWQVLGGLLGSEVLES